MEPWQDSKLQGSNMIGLRFWKDCSRHCGKQIKYRKGHARKTGLLRRCSLSTWEVTWFSPTGGVAVVRSNWILNSGCIFKVVNRISWWIVSVLEEKELPKELKGLNCYQIWWFGSKDKDFNLELFLLYLLYQNIHFYLSIKQSCKNWIEVRCVILGFGREIWAADFFF